jgi:hypothetical protein
VGGWWCHRNLVTLSWLQQEINSISNFNFRVVLETMHLALLFSPFFVTVLLDATALVDAEEKQISVVRRRGLPHSY